MSKLKITLKDSFAMGRIQGAREAFEEILELVKDYDQGLVGTDLIRTYCRSRLRSLLVTDINDAFKQKDGK